VGAAVKREKYACDRCGAHYTTDERWVANDMPLKPNMPRLVHCSYDFCEACESSLNEWFQSGKGAEVNPRGWRT
jgi:hypothetical protein